MFLVYFNTFLIIILITGLIGIYILIFFYNIDLLINNNKIYILSYNASNINNFNDLNLYTYSDVIFLSNFNISNPNIVTQNNNLQEIPVYNLNNNISNQYIFYSASNNNISMMVGLKKSLQVTNIPFLLFRTTTLGIVININEIYHCYIGINQSSNILDIISHIQYIHDRYNKYVIIGELPNNSSISINNKLNNFSIITSTHIVDKYSSTISFLNSNTGSIFVIN
ncbi:unknown similar to AMEV183 [Choristoneura rosaceana entomopoxvirus 'L']|uniref:Uncharacterized protein n=1 Tax=Choristoneura rosaceana entomopoxvirus 'L' TaxID=1293539 RepID=A0ABM9QKP3_9POXV|nr:unknown similar to AMEV183 [Choristoneura rosaceana entomopoxvirus 'L']CCU56094.1 unknown similar to AMEV183 [Choristoneura rosaceana entomopoxvirus 'L']